MGAYSVEKNAYNEGWKQYNAGNKDAYLTTPQGTKYIFEQHKNENPNNKKSNPIPVPEKPEQHKNGTPIMGKSIAKVEQMIAFVKAKNPKAKDIEEIAKSFLEVGAKYGVRGDIAFAQSIIETGWFRFDGGTAVTPDQHNYCGLGVTSKGVKGHSFDTIKDGVIAQIQHLFAYASKEPLPVGEKLIDPRFKYVTRGIAPNWEDLSNRWAMNPNYGAHILNIFEQLIKTTVPKSEPTKPVKEEHKGKTLKRTEKKNVFFTDTEVDNNHLPSVIIDGKGYVSVGEVAKLMGLKVVYDNTKKEFIFIKK